MQVTDVSVTDGAYRVGSYDNFAGSKTIALKINDRVTKISGKMSITDTTFPKIHAGSSLPLTYFAKVSADAPNADNVNAAIPMVPAEEEARLATTDTPPKTGTAATGKNTATTAAS